ncbi:Penicillin-binding protein 2D [Roseivivax sp. THAF40]|uniref:transglycosylase domain-containing protein n=1 Tax=unclassified Roseivivax TaxID=2639302 RepID=UPI00126954E9|nr:MULTISPECIES: PBP1A family penicillin-binding protein [unclassified Roseivivax]QFS84324.1 Penicillin-binding protein 2D [Roseivivax sp. THAF197b]QFT48152.1 Penicillin-binding protein 2D [Roseivivax sp. THAF40]
MSDSGKDKRRLVADRRYASKAKAPARKPAPKKAAKSRRAKPARRHSNPIVAFVSAILRGIGRLIWLVVSRVTLVVVLLIAAWTGYTYTQLPPASEMLDGRAKGSVTLYDRNDEVFAWRGDQFGGVVTADTVSRHLKHAVIATEDRRFYWHMGISPRGVASAIRINLREGRGPLQGHGGSTITQQTAKLLCLGVTFDQEIWESEAAYVADCRKTSLARKAREAIYSLAMEAKYTKDEILSIYLNRAYMGAGAYGAEAASQRYFSKPAALLEPAEGAMLAGLLTAPSTLAPTNDLERSQNRANVVIGLMEDQGYLTAAEAQEARANPATLSEAAERRTGGYFADWVMDTLPPFADVSSREDVEITTTLDPRLQDAAEAAMTNIFESKVREGSKAQAAIVIMSADGAVRAMVGGRKLGVSGVFNRATQAKRQTGSAFKPFVYATALELGYSPYDTVVDEPFCMNIPGSGQWCPENYTRNYAGRVTMTEALKRSLNIPAVKISESVGRDLVARVATDFGIDSRVVDTPSVALGVSEASLLEMTGAFAGILNGGSSVAPYGITRMRYQGDNDPLLDASGGIGERVIQEEAARQLVFMMEKVVAEGTGTRAQLDGRPAAGKTGTSNEQRDAWFVGFTADYVAGVWMGYDDNTPLTGVTGGGLPAEIWREAMMRVHDGLPVRDLPMTVPERPQPQVQQQPQRQQPQPQPQRRQRQNDPVGDILNQVLRDLFGN